MTRDPLMHAPLVVQAHVAHGRPLSSLLFAAWRASDVAREGEYQAAPRLQGRRLDYADP